MQVVPIRNKVRAALTRAQVQFYQDVMYLDNDHEMILWSEQDRITRVNFNEAGKVEIKKS